MSSPEAIGLVRDCALLAALGVALYTDITRGKVYDWCTLPAIGLGLLIGLVAGGFEPAQGNGFLDFFGWPLLDSLAGLALAFGIFGLAWVLHMLGGGDVKLLCAVGALKGFRFFMDAAVLTACAGAILAIVILIWRGRLKEGLKGSLLALVAPSRLRRQRDPAPAGAAEMMTIPYVWAIAAGTAAALALTWLKGVV